MSSETHPIHIVIESSTSQFQQTRDHSYSTCQIIPRFGAEQQGIEIAQNPINHRCQVPLAATAESDRENQFGRDDNQSSLSLPLATAFYP